MLFLKVANDYLLVGVIGILIIIIGLIVYYVVTKAKNKNEEIPRPNVNFETKSLEETLDEMEFTPEPVVEKIVPEVQPIDRSVLESEVNDNNGLEDQKTSTNIASLLEEMQKDLDNPEQQVEKYEADQEENAIISYKELMRLKAEREKSIVLEEKPIEEIKEVLKTSDEEAHEEVKKFKRSEFISPIFGFNDNTNVTYREIKRPLKKEENSRTAEQVEEVVQQQSEANNRESKRNDNFLEALVDFRNNLD